MQDQTNGHPLPSTPQGKSASELVEAVNSGREDLQLRFLETRISENGKRERSVPDSLSLLKKVFQQSRGVEVRQIERSESNPFVFYVTSKNGDYWTRVYLFMDKLELDKISEFGFLPVRDPLSAKELPWAEKRLNDDQTRKEVQRHVERARSKDTFSGVVLVARGSMPIVNLAVGYAEKSFKAANKLDTKFNIGSMNKMFTSL